MSLAVLAMMSTITVSTPAELATAIGKAKGGDVVMLAPGDYGAQRFVDIAYAAPVTFRSADPSRPAKIAKLNIKASRNITFQDIEFTRARGNEQYYDAVIQLQGGSNITFRGGSIHGTLNGFAGDDFMGMRARQVDRLNILNVTFKQLGVALGIDDGTNFVVRGNSFSELSVDSMEIPGAKGGLIENNHFFDYQPAPGAHTDAIQCWTRNRTVGCQDLVIRGNWFDSAPGTEFQGVFFGDEARVGGYNNIEITNNRFNATAWHAIYIGPGSNIVIKNNTITASAKIRPWIKTETPAELSGNSAPAFIIAGNAKVPRGNKIGGLYKGR